VSDATLRAVLAALLSPPTLRDTRTGWTYVPTGVSAAGRWLLSRTDKPAAVAWEVASLDGFERVGGE
jgi:hypothetical protein